MSIKSCEENNLILNIWNIRYICQICGMNLYIYWEHGEWISMCSIMNLYVHTYTENMQNEVNLRINYFCAYSPNMQNDTVCLLRIQWLNLSTCWEYAERICTFTENTWNVQKLRCLGEFELKKINIFYVVTQEPRWVLLAKRWNKKISCKFKFNQWHQYNF